MIESSYCTNTPSHALTGKSGFSNMSLGVVITLGLALSACANKPTYQQNNAQTTITPPRQQSCQTRCTPTLSSPTWRHRLKNRRSLRS